MAASNSFGNLFRITTFGESHGPFIGVVIDGMPAGIEIDETMIEKELLARRGGQNPFTTTRVEEDHFQIVSGLYQGKTTGHPVCLLIENKRQDPSSYAPIDGIFRPGHATFTYLKKYGHHDPRGGGRASARETAARVAAGAFAKKVLERFKITVKAYVSSVGGVEIDKALPLLERVKAEGDSIGGVIVFESSPLPIGLGEPLYQKLNAMLGFGFLSIPACKGVSFGEDFSNMRGSEYNDVEKNHAGGIVGGISNGMPLKAFLSFKPTSSIKKPQKTTNYAGESVTLTLPENSRHDVALVLRAKSVVEAMGAIVLADALALGGFLDHLSH